MSMCRRSGVVQGAAPRLKLLHGFPLRGFSEGQGLSRGFVGPVAESPWDQKSVVRVNQPRESSSFNASPLERSPCSRRKASSRSAVPAGQRKVNCSVIARPLFLSVVAFIFRGIQVDKLRLVSAISPKIDQPLLGAVEGGKHQSAVGVC